MLRLKAISTVVNTIIEFDFYVPIKIEFENSMLEPSFYWSISGKQASDSTKRSLLEMMISKETNIIRELTLVQPPIINSLCRKPCSIAFNTKKQFGLPIFATDKWEHNKNFYLREEKNFDICLENNTLIICFSEKEVQLEAINGRVSFGFDHNNFLCCIQIREIETSERTILKEALKISSTN